MRLYYVCQCGAEFSMRCVFNAAALVDRFDQFVERHRTCQPEGRERIGFDIMPGSSVPSDEE